jgi:tetratricopeptide (TPR) repeat protein
MDRAVQKGLTTMMIRIRWLGVMLACLDLAVSAAAKKDPPKEKPKDISVPEGATRLENTPLYYWLSVPDPYNPKEEYPLLVVAASGDQSKPAFDQWVPVSKADHIFLACLHCPPDSKENQELRICDMLGQLHKRYENVQTRSAVLLGVGGGANYVLRFLSVKPSVFADAIALSPDNFADFKATPPGGRTHLLLTGEVNPKDKAALKKLTDGVRSVSSRLRCRFEKAPAGAGNKPSDDELKLALKVIRSHYSDARLAMVRKAAREEAEKLKAEKEAEKGKEEKGGEKTQEPTKGKEGEPEPPTKTTSTKKPPEKAEDVDPDDLLLKARALDRKQEYADAVRAYKRLAELRPDSDYSRAALKRIDELKADPKVAQALADEAAGPDCKRAYTNGRNYLGAKMYEKARAEFRRVVEKYPDTSYAEEARRELQRLESKE